MPTQQSLFRPLTLLNLWEGEKDLAAVCKTLLQMGEHLLLQTVLDVFFWCPMGTHRLLHPYFEPEPKPSQPKHHAGMLTQPPLVGRDLLHTFSKAW